MEQTVWTDERLEDRFERIDQRFDEVDRQIRDVRAEMRAEMSELRTEMRDGFAELRREVHYFMLATLGGFTALSAAMVAVAVQV
jgi:uncharacterized protein YdhG (YjbR/CyaY superfamily)